jgi:hypothetical protein
MSETTQVYEIPQKEVETKALAMPDQARAIKVVDPATCEIAYGLMTTVKELRKEVDAAYDPTIDATNKAHKIAIAQKKIYETPLIDAEKILKHSIQAYKDEEERKRQEEERRIREILRKQDEERRLEEAAELEKSGDLDAAMEVLNDPTPAPVPIVESNVPKMDGRIFRKAWRARVISIQALVKAAAIDPSLLAYLEPNIPALNASARAQKNLMRIPGVESYEE